MTSGASVSTSNLAIIHDVIENVHVSRNDVEPDIHRSTCAASSKLAHEVEQYRLSGRRWLILSCYCLLTISASSAWFCFTAVTNILKDYYNQSLLAINFLSIVFGIAIVVFALIFAYVLDKLELAIILKMAVMLNATGAVIRYFGSSRTFGYALLVTGNSFTAMSVAAFQFLPGKLAANWFGEKEIGKAVATCIAFDFLGTGFGFLHGTSMIRNSANYEDVESDLNTFLLTQLIPAVAIVPLILLVAKKRPEFPPSKMEAMRLQLMKSKQARDNNANEMFSSDEPPNTKLSSPKPATEISYARSLKMLFKNKGFVLIVIMHGVTQSIEGVYETLLNEILIEKFPGYEQQIGIIGFTGVVLGFVSNIAIGAYIDRQRSYKAVTFIIFTLTAIFASIWSVVIELTTNFATTSVVFCCLLFVCTAYYTVAFAHGCDLTYPISPGITGMVLIVTSQIFGTAFTFITTEMMNNGNVVAVMVTTISLAVLAAVLSLLSRNGPPVFVSTNLIGIGIMTMNVNHSLSLAGPRRPSALMNS